MSPYDAVAVSPVLSVAVMRATPEIAKAAATGLAARPRFSQTFGAPDGSTAYDAVEGRDPRKR